MMATKRTFGNLVNNPIMEDYALRYAPSSFRKWSPWAVLISALGGQTAMASYAIGGSLILVFGFANALWAVIGVSLITFLTALPIAYYIGKNHIDMDLLTRGAGFGYLGSTVTSLIYASFTFIYFSLEGAIMGQAISDFFHISVAWSYLIAVLIIIPLVMFGMTLLSKFQAWTQPLWVILIAFALWAVFAHNPGAISAWTHFGGHSASGPHFSWLLAATAGGVMMSLVAQIGEQADYLRFMPDQTKSNRTAWLWALVLAGPGWILISTPQNILGQFFTSFVVGKGLASQADVPVVMFTQAFHSVIPNVGTALTIATILVVLSQLKINVTNAYSGSLSWSNFFSRTLHRHPGRVVWLMFQLAIGLLIMEMGIFGAIDKVLGFYSNVAVAWIGAVVADLVINKGLLKISPPVVEFRRAHLYNFNPVGFGAMIIASVISLAAYFGLFGTALAAFSSYLSLGVAMIAAPLIAIMTKGKYYIARESDAEKEITEELELARTTSQSTCVSCGFDFEQPDMANCPFHEGSICSLCCTLESACHDMCKLPQGAGLHIKFGEEAVVDE